MITKFGKKESAAVSKKRKAAEVKTEKKPASKKSSSRKTDDAGSDDAAAGGSDDDKKKKPVRKTTKKIPTIVSDDDEDDEAEEPKAKKARTKPVAANGANQELADAFAELSGFEFKRGEKFKGGTWSKVAKAVRDAEDKITSGKQAMKLKGIGKSSGTKIDEFLETGTMATLEEYRAGNM